METKKKLKNLVKELFSFMEGLTVHEQDAKRDVRSTCTAERARSTFFRCYSAMRLLSRKTIILRADASAIKEFDAFLPRLTWRSTDITRRMS
jgi:hypothetical protein